MIMWKKSCQMDSIASCHIQDLRMVLYSGLLLPCGLEVIHYELPSTSELFVHRSGRTGRAGKTGSAILIYTNEQQRAIRGIERDVGFKFTELPRITVEGGDDMMSAVGGRRFDSYGSGRMGDGSSFGRGGMSGGSSFGRGGGGSYGGGSSYGRPRGSGGFGGSSSGRSGGYGNSGSGHFGSFGGGSTSGSAGGFGSGSGRSGGFANFGNSNSSCSSGFGFGSSFGGSGKDKTDDGW